MEMQMKSLVEKYGSPLFVYNGNTIINKYKQFKNAFQVKNLKIHYAAKALTNISILNLLRSIGSGLDCVSIEEVKLGLQVGFKPEDIIFTPNGVSMNEYREAIQLGVKLTIDSTSILEKIGQEFPNYPVFLR